jgi:hypothetical protein
MDEYGVEEKDLWVEYQGERLSAEEAWNLGMSLMITDRMRGLRLRSACMSLRHAEKSRLSHVGGTERRSSSKRG